jgi:hypothetical protein
MYRTTDKIVFLYILIFTFLDGMRENNVSLKRNNTSELVEEKRK